MFKDLLIIPNFFDDPEHIVKVAKSQKYYTIDDHPEDRNTNVYWGSSRTEELKKVLAPEDFSNIQSVITQKVFRDSIAPDAKCDIKFWGKTNFQYFVDGYRGGETSLHKDSGLFAGVVYLNDRKLEDPKSNGTVVFNHAGDSFIMPYEYNTLIFYRSDYTHAPLNGFGNTIDDARLSFSFFIDQIKFDIHRNTL